LGPRKGTTRLENLGKEKKREEGRRTHRGNSVRAPNNNEIWSDFGNQTGKKKKKRRSGGREGETQEKGANLSIARRKNKNVGGRGARFVQEGMKLGRGRGEKGGGA